MTFGQYLISFIIIYLCIYALIARVCRCIERCLEIKTNVLGKQQNKLNSEVITLDQPGAVLTNADNKQL